MLQLGPQEQSWLSWRDPQGAGGSAPDARSIARRPGRLSEQVAVLELAAAFAVTPKPWTWATVLWVPVTVRSKWGSVGPTGTGKSPFCTALGVESCR